jgi:hypothetical protein
VDTDSLKRIKKQTKQGKQRRDLVLLFSSRLHEFFAAALPTLFARTALQLQTKSSVQIKKEKQKSKPDKQTDTTTATSS